MVFPLLRPVLSKISRKVSLQVILACLVLQIPAMVGLTGYLSFKNGQEAVDDLANQLTNKIGDRVEQKLKDYLIVPQLITRLNANQVRAGTLDLDNLSEVQLYLWQQFQQFNDLKFNNPTFITIATETGNSIGIGYRPFNRLVVDIRDLSKGKKVEVWRLNDWGDRVRLRQVFANYDPRKQPWYRAALAAGKLFWVNPSVGIGEDDLLLSVDRPLYNRQGKLVGVTHAALSLSDVSHFLRKLEIGQTGQVFIMETNGTLVGTSTSEKIFSGSTIKSQRVNALESKNSLTRQTAGFLEKRFNGFTSISRPLSVQFNASEDGQTHFVAVRPFRDYQGLNWLVAIVIPEQDFMGKIHENTRHTVLLCLAALGVAVAVAIATSRWIARPILQLSAAAESLAQNDWHYPITIQRSDELGILASSFQQMRDELRRSRLLLEEYASGLEQKNEKLSTLEAELRQQLNLFLHAVSHDLRNPVIGTSIVLNNLNAQPGEAIAVSRLVLHRMIDSNHRQLELINSLIDTHAAEIWGITLHCQSLVLRDLVESAIADLQPLIERENVLLKNLISTALPLIHVDPLQIARVYQNLIANALKHNPPGVILNLHAQQVPGWINCSVSDNGAGISPEQCEKIFNPYFRGNPRTKSVGLGLGLYLCQQIVQAHGGRIWVESQLGQGTTFWFTLPIDKLAA
ncbi:MAG: sensor histidine kinase [Timaviella obliquedivisa GSE-PSE-MK23-08B]|nr:sensor histidine kinase [Timaviella obliquedivisa GSE-PSE-MK23-08B]